MHRRQWGVGLLFTLLIAVVWWFGLLDFAERLTLDLRARWFGFNAIEPSDRLVIVGIDDAALSTIGRWPWDRARMARVIDELRLAGAKVIALDLLLDEPQVPRLVAVQTPGAPESVRTVRDDDLLAEAIRRHGAVVVAGSFRFGQTDAQRDKSGAPHSPAMSGQVPTPTAGEAEKELATSASTEDGDTADAPAADPLGAASDQRLAFNLPLSAVMDAIAAQPSLATEPFDDAMAVLVRRFLPPSAWSFQDGPEFRELRRKLGAARLLIDLAPNSSRAVPETGLSLRWATSTDPTPTLPRLAGDAARLGNVTFDTFDADGLTRRVPLWVRHRDRLWPNLGLAAAMLYLNVPLDQVSIVGNSTIVPMPEGEPRRLSTFGSRLSNRQVDGLHYVTWPRALLGKPVPDSVANGWQWQFYSLDRNTGGEFPIGAVYEPANLASLILTNLQQFDRAFTQVYLNPADPILQGGDADDFRAAMNAILEHGVDDEMFPAYLDAVNTIHESARTAARARLATLTAQKPIEQLEGRERILADNLTGALEFLPRNIQQAQQGLLRISESRARTRERLNGKIVFVGWTATGAAADFVATSIHPKTPGVHLHVAVANSVLTGYAKVPGPRWADFAALLIMGVLATWIGVSSSVLSGPASVILLVGAWFGVVGLVLWDQFGLIVSAAGPAAGALSAVVGVFVHRLFVEQRSRRRTEERFKSYVSPEVVDILVNNPSLDSMKPQRRTLSIMFTDLAGFTSTAEKLGSDRTAEVLRLYLGPMTEILQGHRGTLDKYNGDAILGFWGAPVENLNHAKDACETALDMLRTLDRMNSEHAFGENVELAMRIGIATGEVMVGDFGNPPRNSSYTVIGDTANIASRLEGANKAFGSRILVPTETLIAAGGSFRSRLVGKIRVKGRAEPMELHELIGDLQPFAERSDEYIEHCNAIVRAFQAGELESCLAKCDELDRDFGPRRTLAVSALGEIESHPFAQIYRDACLDWLQRDDRDAAFDGALTLTEK